MDNKGEGLTSRRATELAALKPSSHDQDDPSGREDAEAAWMCQEAALVRLVIYALQGVGNTLNEITKLSEVFCSTPADRTVHGVSNWWHRTSSANGFGKLLKSVGHSGHIFLFLSKFVDRFLYMPMDDHCHDTNRNITCQKQVGTKTRGSAPTAQTRPIYTLVNQAFAVALKNVLNGYICALNTLHASVKLRRSLNCDDKTQKSLPALGSLTSIVYPEITLIEVYLHTRELRNQIEAVANICCLGDENILMQISHGKSLSLLIEMAFENFPRGANLLTYLYVQLRDADPVHYNLLKMLFSYSCEPYIAFIKAWIYRGRVDDPHNEFALEVVDRKLGADKRHGFLDNLCLPFVKERADVCLPCFLRDMHDPLLRTGQQLQILIRLLELCSYYVSAHYNNRVESIAHGFIGFEDVLPCWTSSWNNSSCLPSLGFTWEEIREVAVDREAKFNVLLEKLEIFFTAVSARNSKTKDVKWGVSEPSQRIAKIQTLLDQALQKSSCENDLHKQRLYIYSAEHGNMPLSTTDIGAFNFVQLGYKVDWPLSVVLNPGALKIYSDIFSFLMQVRISLFTLADVWQSLKAFKHTSNQNKFHSTNSSKSFSTFMKLRLQVNHFVTTLHQYVQSQLSDVSWCKFFSSLKHQVKDMLDLESMHMSYLSDALHICFLSVETQMISSIITKILQCGLDLRLCVTALDPGAGSDALAQSANMLVQINLPEVLAIKATFEKNLNDLYLCFLKSPKHGEFGLCRFWRYLNYNSYYSNTISGDIWH